LRNGFFLLGRRKVRWHNLPINSLPKAAAMPTRNVVLTERQAHLVDSLVNSGRFQNASEVLRAGLRLIEREEVEMQEKLEVLRDAARAGIADVEAGRLNNFSSAVALGEYLDAITDDVLAPTEATKRSQ
jgi:antitoxin ParD1/3/4